MTARTAEFWLKKACHEGSQLPPVAQEAGQGLPRHPPQRSRLRDQQEESAVQSPPGLSDTAPNRDRRMLLPPTDTKIVARRAEIVAALKAILPDGVVADPSGLATFDADALSA